MKTSAAIALLMLLSGMWFGAGESPATTHTKTGDAVPAFQVTTLDDTVIDSAVMDGKVLVINFFATWCGPCREELPRLKREVWDKHRTNDDFVLVVIGREHTREELEEFKSKTHFAMPLAPDPNRDVYGKFATQFIPRTYVIGRDGRIAYQSMGYNPAKFDEFKDAVRNALEDDGR